VEIQLTKFVGHVNVSSQHGMSHCDLLSDAVDVAI
jgi:hypothetical protein